MIKKNNKEVGFILKGTQNIDSIYHGTDLVFEQGFTREQTGVPPITTNYQTIGKDLKDYRIYGNSVQNGTPTPDNPIEIQSVGDKTKNLFDKSKVTLDKRLYTNDTNLHADTISLDFFTSEFIKVEPNTQYYYSEIGTTYTTRLLMANSNKGFIKNIDGNTNPIITTTADTEYVIFCGLKSDINNFMFAKSSDIVEYEPFGYRIPVNVKGKNICNPNSFTNTGKLLDGTTGSLNSNNNYKTTDFIFIKAGTYTLSLDNTYGGTIYTTTRMCLYNTNYGYTGNVVNDTSERPTHPIYTFTIANDCYYRLSVRNTDTNIQLEKSGTETPYEPYVSPRTTNIYLNEPLRKIGDYADYIDFKNSKVVRNLGYRVFTRITTNTAYDSTLSATLEFNLSNSVHLSPILSNRAVNGNIVADSNIGQARIYQGYFQIRVKYPDGITNANTKAEKRVAYNQWLSNHNIDLIYRLNTPTEETIELPDIPTFRGTTTYSVDTNIQPSNMYIMYNSK